MTHPYYIGKAIEHLRRMEADEDASPYELAAWGETAKDDQLVLITPKGHVVGYGLMITQKHMFSYDYHERIVTPETYEEYELGELEWRLDYAAVAISKQIGEPVKWVDKWAFRGQSNIWVEI